MQVYTVNLNIIYKATFCDTWYYKIPKEFYLIIFNL